MVGKAEDWLHTKAIMGCTCPWMGETNAAEPQAYAKKARVVGGMKYSLRLGEGSQPSEPPQEWVSMQDEKKRLNVHKNLPVGVLCF